MSNLAKRLLLPINTSVISILGLYNFVLGVWMILPFDSTRIGSILPEYMLGIISIITGILIVYGAVRNKYKYLQLGSLAGFYYWMANLFLLISSEYWTQAPWITSLMAAMYCGFVYLNLKVNKNYIENLRDK